MVGLKKLFLVFVTLLSCNSLVLAENYGYPGTSKFNVHIDFGTLLYTNSASVNLERHLVSSYSGKTHLYARAGYGYAGLASYAGGKGGLGALTLLTGSNKHHFELVCGVFMGNDSDYSTSNDFFALPIVDVGYRYQKPGRSFIFRSKVGFLGLGIGLGYAF